MSEEEYISKIRQFISDIEKVRNDHDLEYQMCRIEKTDLSQKISRMHFDKKCAYDFVLRKLRRTFNLINNAKSKN